MKASELLDMLVPRTESSRDRARREIRESIMADDPSNIDWQTSHSPSKRSSRPGSSGLGHVIGLGPVDKGEWIEGPGAIGQLLLDRGWGVSPGGATAASMRPDSASRRPKTSGDRSAASRPRWWVEGAASDYEEVEVYRQASPPHPRRATGSPEASPRRAEDPNQAPSAPLRGDSLLQGPRLANLQPFPKASPPTITRLSPPAQASTGWEIEGGVLRPTPPPAPRASPPHGDPGIVSTLITARPRAGGGRFMRDETPQDAMKRLKNVYRNLKSVEEGLAWSRPGMGEGAAGGTAAPPPIPRSAPGIPE